MQLHRYKMLEQLLEIHIKSIFWCKNSTEYDTPIEMPYEIIIAMLRMVNAVGSMKRSKLK